jgi:DNA repair exonuclease SbcCD ATPase subunit
MVDLDTSGEGQEVELPQEESTENKEVEKKVEEKTNEEETDKKEEINEDESKDDGLDKYSKNVQKRIKKLLDRLEKSEQQKEEALKFAQSAKKKADEAEFKINSLDKNYISEYEDRVKSQIEQTKTAYQKAIEDNDVKGQVEAQRALTRLAIEEERALASKQQRENIEKQKEGLMAEKKEEVPKENTPPSPDPRAEQWAKDNEWFGKDEAMTYTALSHHKKLLKEGYDPKSDEYYDEINSYIRQEFPHKFKEEASVEKEKAPQVVASTSRTTKNTSSKKVKLTPSQVAIAKKLGVPLEEYAKYV